MGAKAAVPHADGVFGRQSRCHEGVRETFDGEGGDGQACRRSSRGPSTRTPGMACKPSRNKLADVAVVGDDRGPADLGERVDRGVQGHCPDDVRRARLLAFGRGGPDDLVELDEVDGAATGEERVTVGEGFPRADEHSGAEGRVHLVPAPGDEVGLRGQGTVRRELGAVDGDGDSPIVRAV